MEGKITRKTTGSEIVSDYGDALLTFAIWRRFPDARKLRPGEHALLSAVALSQCRLAISLAQSNHPDEKLVHWIFRTGAGLFDALCPVEPLDEWLDLATHELVVSQPDWHFSLLIGFVLYSDHRDEALRRIIDLKPEGAGRAQTESLFECILTGDLPFSEETRLWLAKFLLDDGWAFSRKWHAKKVLKLAKDVLKG